jgi:UDP-N-acetylglucosamine acyltransferase
VLNSHAVVRRYTEMGENNTVDSFAVLGGFPQDYDFNPTQVTALKIGHGNIFREGVTVNRATGDNCATVVGNDNYWFTNSHAGHNATIGNQVVLVNGALVAGHATIGDRVILPANGGIHQFCWVGEGVMFQGKGGLSMHTPPYVLCAEINIVIGLNTVGLRRRKDISKEDIRQIKEAFNIVYRSGLGLEAALAKMDACTDWGPAAGKFREFIRDVFQAEPPFNRGLCPHLSRSKIRR